VPRVRVDEQPRPRLAKFKTPATLLSYFGISILPGMVFLSISTGRTKMPDEPPSPTLDVALTTNIVAAYVRRSQIASDQLAALFSTVHEVITSLGKPARENEGERTPTVPIRRSVHRDYVICLECGWHGQMPRRHVATGQWIEPRPISCSREPAA
jgi:hypothetical protein